MILQRRLTKRRWSPQRRWMTLLWLCEAEVPTLKLPTFNRCPERCFPSIRVVPSSGWKLVGWKFIGEPRLVSIIQSDLGWRKKKLVIFFLFASEKKHPLRLWQHFCGFTKWISGQWFPRIGGDLFVEVFWCNFRKTRWPMPPNITWIPSRRPTVPPGNSSPGRSTVGENTCGNLGASRRQPWRTNQGERKTFYRFRLLMVQKSGDHHLGCRLWSRLSHDLQGFSTIPSGCLGFLNHQLRILQGWPPTMELWARYGEPYKYCIIHG